MKVENRSEIVFLYDVTDANPNGDPLDENKPRVDEETGRNIVTDVRLKRTIRDYFVNYGERLSEKKKLPDDLGYEVFIQPEKVYEKGMELLKTRGAKLEEELCELLGQSKKFEKEETEKIAKNIHEILGKDKIEKMREKFKECLEERSEEDEKTLFEEFNKMRTTKIKEKVLHKFIDLRLFGATLAVANINVQVTGPVQFNFGRSLHQVDDVFYRGYITMPVEPEEGYEKGKKKGEPSEEYRLPYSLIVFYGVVNENAAKTTGLTEEDVRLLLDGIWNGSKNLITRSKIGHSPRLLFRIVYGKGNFHIGDLRRKIKLEKEKDERKIRSISEVKLDISELIETLKQNAQKIDKIELKVDENLELVSEGEEIIGKDLGTHLRKAVKKVEEVIFI